MTAKAFVRSTLLITGALLLAGCEYQSERTSRLISESVSHTDPEKQSRFKEALKREAVPYEIYTGDDGREYVKWGGADSAKVKQIDIALFGEPLPEGRSIHFGGARHEEFKNWLKENGIRFETRISDGKEYVIWSAADYSKVAAWKNFPKHYLQHFPLSSNPTVDTDARKSRARGSP
jgi:hypothetical protein